MGFETVAQDIVDRRKHERINVSQVIYIEILQRGTRRETQENVIRCETVDVSVQGLCVYVPMKIRLGSKLNIAVPEDGWIENLELVGEARWQRPAEDGEGYWLGLELHDTSKENMAKWFKTVSILRKQNTT